MPHGAHTEAPYSATRPRRRRPQPGTAGHDDAELDLILYPKDADGDDRRILKAAEHAVLRAGSDRLVVTCPADQKGLREQLQRQPQSIVAKTDDRYTIPLIVPTADGLIHDDFDFRTPLGKTTCPTCVERIAESRTRARREAFTTRATPQQISALTHLIAEAYTRLAQIEEALHIPPPTFADQAA